MSKSREASDNELVTKELGPNSKRKVEQILTAARELFTVHGFGATSMDAVALQAGVGKATVYAHFKSKHELFIAVIAYEAQVHTIALVAGVGDDVAAILERFAFDAFDLLLSPTSIAVVRTVSAEAIRFPELGRLFFETGPASVIDRLAEFLSSAMEQGQLRPASPRLAATQFLGMICGDLQLRATLGLSPQISDQTRHSTVQSGVSAFLRAYKVAAGGELRGSPPRR